MFLLLFLVFFINAKIVLQGFNTSWILFFRLLVFLGVYLIISFVIKIYSKWYIRGSTWINYFYLAYVGFFIVIWFMVLSKERLNFIIFWELLGVSRFFLVLFFVNWERIRGAINTMLANHLGGLFLILVMWFTHNTSVSIMPVVLVYLMVVSFRKRAQLPFSAWLPMAISAPTPVRSLVHRRTLVTAGLFIVWLYRREGVGVIGWWVRLITLFLSGLLALVEKDLKKLVALRTLSQISFCIILLLVGLEIGSFFQILSHAIFKSCLFLQVGVVIYFTFGSQEFRVTHTLQMVFLVILFLCVISLRGLLFLSGMFRKELSLRIIFNKRRCLVVLIIMIVRVSLTLFYSWLLLKSLLLLTTSSESVSLHSIRRLILFLGVMFFGLFFRVWAINLQFIYVEGLVAFLILLWTLNWILRNLKWVSSFFYLLILREVFKFLRSFLNKSLGWVEVLNNRVVLCVLWLLRRFSIKVKVFLRIGFFVFSVYLFLLL